MDNTTTLHFVHTEHLLFTMIENGKETYWILYIANMQEKTLTSDVFSHPCNSIYHLLRVSITFDILEATKGSRSEIEALVGSRPVLELEHRYKSSAEFKERMRQKRAER